MRSQDVERHTDLSWVCGMNAVLAEGPPTVQHIVVKVPTLLALLHYANQIHALHELPKESLALL